MFINLAFDTAEMTDLDRATLRALADAGQPTGAVVQMADAKAAQAKAQEAPEESAPAPTRSRTRKAAAKAPEPEPEPQDDAQDSDEDLLGDDGPTLDDAVARATDLVQEDKGEKVKAALRKVGVPKVRNLEGEQIAEFLDLLKKA